MAHNYDRQLLTRMLVEIAMADGHLAQAELERADRERMRTQLLGKVITAQEEERQRIQDKVDKLKQSKFKQQMLPAWRPVPSFASTMITFSVFGIIFLSLGIALYVMS